MFRRVPCWSETSRRFRSWASSSGLTGLGLSPRRRYNVLVMAGPDEIDSNATTRFTPDVLRRFRLEAKAPCLLVLLGPDLGFRIPLTRPEITIGRTNDADIILHDSQISRRHIAVRSDLERGIYVLRDLGSTNGTQVNQRDVTEAVLSAGDKIFIGATTLKFSLEDEVDSEHGARMNEIAFNDDLTGLVVKRRFYDELQYEVQHALSSSRPLGVLMMDLDGLKRINDAHGHATGAGVIAESGRIIGAIVTPLGQACRWGGDEFIAFLRHHGRAESLAIGEQIRAAIAAHRYEQDGVRLPVSISIGIAALPESARDAKGLTTSADAALYRAKHQGRNCVSE